MFEAFDNITSKLSRLLAGPSHTNDGVQCNMPQAEFEPNSFSQLLPYQSFDEQTSLYFNKKSVGFIIECYPKLGASEEEVTILSSILTDVLPKRIDLQAILWASPKIENVLTAFEQARSQTHPMLKWLAGKRTHYLRKLAHATTTKQHLSPLRDFRLILMASGKQNDTNTDALLAFREDLQSTLNSIEMPNRLLEPEQFISLMGDILNPDDHCTSYQQSWNELQPIAEQLISPEYHISLTSDAIDFDNGQMKRTASCFTIKDFPKSMAQWKMQESIGQLFNDHLQIPCPFLVSFNLRVLDNDKATQVSQMKTLKKESTAKSPLAKFKPNADKEYQDWHFVRQRLADGDKLVKGFYSIVLFSPSEKAHQSESKLRDLYAANGWKLQKERYLQLQTFLASLPFFFTEGLYQDLKLLGRLTTMTAFNATNLLPIQGEYKGSSTPSMILPGRRGQIATFNPFDSQEGNFNMAIAAKSGSGKSVFTQEYISSLLGSGGRVWVIDVGRSYEKTCRILDGEFICFEANKPICINPFTHITDFEHEALPMLKPLLAAMMRPDTQVSAEEYSFIEKALKAAWDEKANEATMTTVANWLKTQEHPICQNLNHLLYTYTTDGMYGHYFEGPCTVNIDNPFVVLELQELKTKKDLQKVVLLVMMYQITTAMYLGDRRQAKSCVIDEAWDLLGGNNSGAASFIETGYRTARRYRGNFVTITQSINDYFKNDASIAAFENSDYLLLLAQLAETLEKVKQLGRLDMNPFTERLYKSLKRTEHYSEVCIKGPQGLSVHRILLDPYARILFSSRAEDVEAVKNRQAQGYSLTEAIEHVAHQQYGDSL